MNLQLIIGAAFLVVLGFAGCEHQRAKAAVSRVEALELAQKAAISANESAMATIDAQNKALQDWAKLGKSREEIEALIAAAEARQAELDKLKAVNARLKELDNASPDCEKLRQVDFERVCPNRARVLRQYERRHQDSDG